MEKEFKMKLSGKINRLGVFIFYDRDNLVDDYVLYLLDDFKKCVNHLTVISNSSLDEENLKKLKKYTEDIIIRENKGLDAGALKEFFVNHKTYLDYDEVVCMNDTFFGPFYSFQKVFDKMNEKDVDFFGLSLGHIQPDGYKVMPNGYIPNHIQTFFIAFRKSLTNHQVFQDYWKNYDIDKMLDFQSVVINHELQFTEFLKNHGFVYDVYVEDENVSENFLENYNNYHYNSSSQIISGKAPFIKRKTLVADRPMLTFLTDKNDLNDSLEFIQNETNYDVSLIWKNILRLYNLNDLKHSMGLNQIVKEHNVKGKYSVSLMLYNDNELFCEKITKKIKELALETYLFTSNEHVFETFKKDGLLVEKVLEGEWSQVLKKVSKKITSTYIGYLFFPAHKECITLIDESVLENYLENLISSQKYISSVLEMLDENSNMGMVYAPNNLHYTNFFGNLIWEEDSFSILKRILPEYKNFDEDKVPFVKTNAWFIKSELLDDVKFLDWKISDNEKFSKILSLYLAYYITCKSYYPVIVTNEKNLLNRLNIYESIYEETYHNIYKQNYFPLTFSESVDRFSRFKLNNSFLSRVKRFIKRVLKKLFSYQEIRFLFVGGLNTVVGYGTYILFVFLGINYLISNTMSTIIGVAHSYLWNRFFTFKSKEKALQEILKFISVYLLSYFIGLGVLYLVVQKFGINEYIAGLINLVITTFISFFGHKYFSFRRRVK